MAPRKSGFNLLAWLTPGVTVLVAGGALLMMLRRWGTKRDRAAAAATPLAVDGTPDELARLDAAVKGDDRT
jgi:cytochrome c-type biogenesis protein CcmH/NrfF